MKKLRNRAFAAILSLIMVVSVISFMPVKAEEATKTAYVTIEKLTIGQGFVLQPVKVTFEEGATVTDVVNKAAVSEGVELVYTSSEYGTYLSAIKKADSGAVNIPATITNLGDFESYGMTYSAPTNENISANPSLDGTLSEMTFTEMSGWMYSVNNEGIITSASETKVQDGDVIRVQFSIYGWGLDIGHADFNTGNKVVSLANKDRLIKLVAEIKADPTTLNSGAEDVFDVAIATLENYDATQESVDNAYQNLKNVSHVEIVEPTSEDATAEPTSEPATGESTTKEEINTENIDIAVQAVQVKKAVKKNRSAKSIKVTLKKLKGTTGYQVKVYLTKANAKAGKKAVAAKKTKKNVKTVIVENKKLKNKKKLFVKARAYKTVGKKTYFGVWSNIVKVKIKK